MKSLFKLGSKVLEAFIKQSRKLSQVATWNCNWFNVTNESNHFKLMKPSQVATWNCNWFDVNNGSNHFKLME